MIQNIIIILNIFLIESILSVDNASILAVMVKDLPTNQQKKALTWGILGAMGFRGLCLFIASWLMGLYYLKILGGLYLLYLSVRYFLDKQKEETESRAKTKKLLQVIILVELVDLSLSVDNILAVTALTSNIYLIFIGVFMGIITMRFIAGWFIKLICKYPSLEQSAYIVIILLGVKLIIEGILKKIKPEFILSDISNLIFSLGCMATFFIPIIIAKGDDSEDI